MPDSRDEQIAKLRQTLASLEEQQRALGIDLSASLVQLRQLLAQLEQSAAVINLGAGSIAQQGGIAAGAGGVAAQTIQGSVYIGAPPRDDAEAVRIYCRVVAQTCGQLPLRGVD